MTVVSLALTAGVFVAGLATKVAAENLVKGRIIRDMLIGIPGPDDPPGKIPVHIYSEEVRTPNSIADD